MTTFVFEEVTSRHIIIEIGSKYTFEQVLKVLVNYF